MKTKVKGDFGLGSPNLMPPFLVLLTIVFQVLNFVVRRHGYAPSNGLAKTRKAFADRIFRMYGCRLNPDTEVTMTEGSRESIPYILSRHPGTIILPLPFYPGHYKPASKAKGSDVVMLEMPSVEFYLNTLENHLKNGVRVSVVFASFDNPNWIERTVEDYARLVQLARKYNFVIISDEAYAELGYYSEPVSIMQVPGWKEVAYVLHTGSKAFSMAGWKLGIVVAREDRIPAIAELKADKSEGGNEPGQLGLATAYNYCSNYSRKKAARIYRERAEFTAERFAYEAGIPIVTKPAGGMFLWFALPAAIKSSDFVSELAEYGYIVYDGAKYGKPGYVRWCLRENLWKTSKACECVRRIWPQLALK